MIVIDKNEGTKIPYEVNGTKISFDDDTMSLKCDKFQKDWPIHKDICMDRDGGLTMGISDGVYYVAEVDIPAREYTEPVDEETAPEPLPLDMEKVTLTLWSLDDLKPAEKEEESEE